MRSPALSTQIDLEIPRRELFEMVTALVGEPGSDTPFEIVTDDGLQPGARLRFHNPEDPRQGYEFTLSRYARARRIEVTAGPPRLGLRLSATFDDRKAGTRLRVSSYFVAESWRRKLLVILTWPFIWPVTFILQKWFSRRIRRALRDAEIRASRPTDHH